ncbi:MAG: ABC transporter permease [Verrucomicrobiota bacterium]
MQTVRNFFGFAGECVLVFFRSLTHLPSLPWQFGRLMDYCFHIGYKTMPMVSIMAFFLGAVLVLQTGYSLKDFAGANIYLGRISGLGMSRELAPLISALLLAGRVGSSVTAELASMKVYHEIDALKTMNVPPERILVMPRLVAIVLMMPIVVGIAIFVGWYGGAMAANQVPFINQPSEVYWANLKDVVSFRDIIDGQIKGMVFGLAVIVIACTQGLSTKGGPREIGMSVTSAVVASMVLILLLDYLLTRILM